MADAMRCLAGVALALALSQSAVGADADPLQHGFDDPPASARPRVWWHWMNGNITREGIDADLHWMKRVGLGGFQTFDAALGTPQVVDQRLVYMTPAWRDAFAFATRLADELGLEEAIAGSPGWSESGGPWVTPAQAMKKVVWSETRITGGKRFQGMLAQPPDNGGPFQGAPFIHSIGEAEYTPPSFYADSVAIAIRVPDAEVRSGKPAMSVSSSAGPIDAGILDDGDLGRVVPLPIAPVGEEAWIQFDYGTPHAVRALSYARNDHGVLEMFHGAPPGPELLASDDGRNWRSVVVVPAGVNAAQMTVSFPAVTARYFRARFKTAPPPPAFGIDFESLGVKVPPPSRNYQISELALRAGARVHHAEEKAGFMLNADLSALATPEAASEFAVAKASVVDLTSRMRPGGALDWTPPPGQWVVLRFGYSPTGITNHPASPEGTGLEVDKLSAAHVRSYMTHYLDSYQSTVGPLMGKRGLQYLISDSYEAGPANWTDDLIEQFRKRRGYDPTPWFPVLTGRVMESAAASDRFLWDYRRTLADLIAENHYALITQMLHERGMGHYGESHENGRAFIGDGMEAKRSNDVPMAAMWTQVPGVYGDQPGYNADIRESASVAHLYGQNLVAAESFTAGAAPYAWSPETLKPTADKELAMGLNRFVIHTSVHQPLMGKAPGLGLGPIGQWFNRNETWAEAPAKAWVDYLARSSFLLQQGRFAADIAYFYGEDSNITALFGKAAPAIPAGYNFDYVNADALQHLLRVKDGELVTPSGMRYRLLVLDPRAARMSLPVLKSIRELVSQGATLVGDAPVSTPSLADDTGEFARVVAELWQGSGMHGFGKGRVYAGQAIATVLQQSGIAPDVEFGKAEKDPELLYVHRVLEDGDIYFVNNRSAHAVSVATTFRVDGREPELWHADSGRREPAGFQRGGGRTTVPLQLDAWGAVFVVFRRTTNFQAREQQAVAQQTLAAVHGPWKVSFQPDRGAPPTLTVDALDSWSHSDDAGVRYFSGSARYVSTLKAPRDWFKPGARLWLDLGDVKNLASVRLNGRDLGVLWKPPFKAEVTDVLRPGANDLQVEVTNLWVNRLIGDRQANAEPKYTFSVPALYKADSELLPSGLIGPVAIIRTQESFHHK